MKPEVSVTIPIYNEEKGIEKTVVNLVKEFEDKKINYQFVLVNHGSWDNTEKILRRLGEKNKRLKVINLAKNLGYGGGIQYGFEHSDGGYIGFTCADEEVSAQDVCKIFLALKNGDYDVSKSRRMKRKDGIFRIITTTIFNSLISLKFGLGIKDVNGYPIFMKKDIFPYVKTKELTYLFNLDLLKKIKAHGYKILEVPIIHRKRETGKTFMKPSRIFKMAFGFFKYSLKF